MEKLYKILEKREQIKEELNCVNKLSKKAFRVFKNVIPLAIFPECKEAWDELESKLIVSDAAKIDEAFCQVQEAIIPRQEFQEKLIPAKEEVETYISSLKDEITKNDKLLLEAYYCFLDTEDEEIKEILKSKIVMSRVLKFLS